MASYFQLCLIWLSLARLYPARNFSGTKKFRNMLWLFHSNIFCVHKVDHLCHGAGEPIKELVTAATIACNVFTLQHQPGVYIFQIPQDTFPPIPSVYIFPVSAATIACNVFTDQPEGCIFSRYLGIQFPPVTMQGPWGVYIFPVTSGYIRTNSQGCTFSVSKQHTFAVYVYTGWFLFIHSFLKNPTALFGTREEEIQSCFWLQIRRGSEL